MPEPLAICLENLDPRKTGHRYTRCTALVGRQPGLRIDDTGCIQWEEEGRTAAELWVSLDDRLILYRPSGGASVVVRRGGRSLDVPEDKPVVVLDQDLFTVGDCEYRIHVHGVAPAVSEPTPLVTQARNAAAGVATAVALSAALVGCCGPLEVREEPPTVAIPEEPADDDSAGPPTPEPPTEEPTEAVTPAVEPIEVRVEPPAATLEPPPPPPVDPPADKPDEG